mmetsp:Transcript_40815/g.114290  ORF Transcript_40815/g.114290 Transcript_40815/m.114290 type:complete len:98 (+) Transcript_40815:74-367(+)
MRRFTEEGRAPASLLRPLGEQGEVVLSAISLNPVHFERCRILRRFFCSRRVLFFFHFHRNIERAFLYGLDLCAIAVGCPRGPPGGAARLAQGPRLAT